MTTSAFYSFARSLVTTTIVAAAIIGFVWTRHADAAPLALTTNVADAVGSNFTYQGVLTDNGAPANGLYDFRFEFQAPGGVVLATYIAEDTNVVNGLFTATIPAANIFEGERRFLEISAKKEGEEAFVEIGEATEVQPAPYAIFANGALNAAHAVNADQATNAEQAVNAAHATNADQATNAVHAQTAETLTNAGETVIQVGNFGMFQGGTSATMNFAARGTGLMEVTTALGTEVGFVYLPVDIPTQVIGFNQKLKTLSFCYSGAADNGIGPLAGIDVIQVRQVDKLAESTLLNQSYPSYITNANECVNVTADPPVAVTGSVWIMFRVVVSNTPLKFGEVKLTFASE